VARAADVLTGNGRKWQNGIGHARRYAIVSGSDLREGTKKIAAKMKAEAGTN
jgi:hypothetical protein